ncbi:MAG: helix-turn-helix domain-containing protein [Chloroflexota bacterium]|nr:helix-turn-helix domain-containing protein [Chloroflexota bacterium]
MSQEELAERAGISARTISDLERGQRSSARFETVRMLADALELPQDARALMVRAAQSPMVDVTLRHALRVHPICPALPVPQTALIGREQDVHDVVAELGAGFSRVVTLTGPGGVGKTRLAIAIADRAADRFPGGVAWVDLSRIHDPAEVSAVLTEALSGSECGSSPKPAGSDESPRPGRFLLVVDNFEHVSDAAPALADLLSVCAHLSILVTSRSPLRLTAEVVVLIEPLPVPSNTGTFRECAMSDSVRLFVARAQASRRDFTLRRDNWREIVEICRRVDGFPLGIELAASRITTLSPATMLERLDDRLSLLTGGFRDAPPRQQAMTTTIAWSYDLLAEPAQRLFRLLSVFGGGFGLDTVEWLGAHAGTPDTPGIDELETLVESNLVRRVPAPTRDERFTMFETIRAFGLAELNQRGEVDWAHDLLVAYCLGIAPFGDGVPTCIVPGPWLLKLDQERDNIRAAYRFLVQSGSPGRLFAFMTAFGHYLYNRGPYSEVWTWFQQALPGVREHPPALQMQGLYWASHLAAHLGDRDRALELGQEALGIAREVGDLAWIAAIVHCLGMIHHFSGEFERAEELLTEELRLWDEAGTLGLSAFAFLLLGEIAGRAGTFALAHQRLETAADLLRDMDGLGWVAVTRWLHGVFFLAEDLLAEAAEQFQECLELSLDHHASLVHHQGLIGLAAVASALGMHGAAGRLTGAALMCLDDLSQQLGPFDRPLYERTIATSCSALGADAFDQLQAAGRHIDQQEWLRTGRTVVRMANGEGILDGTTQRMVTSGIPEGLS